MFRAVGDILIEGLAARNATRYSGFETEPLPHHLPQPSMDEHAPCDRQKSWKACQDRQATRQGVNPHESHMANILVVKDARKKVCAFPRFSHHIQR